MDTASVSFPSIAGLPHNRPVDLMEVVHAFEALKVSPDAAICPWPDDESREQAVAEHALVVINENNLARVLITKDALTAVMRSPQGDPDKLLRYFSNMAFTRVVFRSGPKQFQAYMEGGTWFEGSFRPLSAVSDNGTDAYTALAVMRAYRGAKDVVITLWSQVADTALAADTGIQEEWARHYRLAIGPLDGEHSRPL
ncbi:hypothetical protein [Nocardia sp. NPDC052566]|uniref:hypothetical protein n=1 Tax=Nocardia sp. NPDC052566 TaxID=3364330 RepID=UPI0037C623FA